MKKLLHFFFLLGCVFNLKAQQDGYQTHFQFNEISYNPSYAGKTRNSICVSSLFHQQYLGFESDEIRDSKQNAVIKPYNIAPQTQFYTVSARLSDNLGIGVQLMNDRIGPQSIALPKVQMAYYFNWTTSHLAIGLYAGALQKSLDGSRLIPLSMLQAPYQPDPLVPDNLVTDTKLDMGIGIHYVKTTFFNLKLGASLTHIKNQNYRFTNFQSQSIVFSNTRPHLYFNGAMDFPFRSKIVIQPNILVKYGAKWQYDLNVLAIYNQSYYTGFSYRQNDNLNWMLGYMIGDFKAGYAFDMVLSQLQPGSKTSHEIFIQYCFKVTKRPSYLINPRHLKDYSF